MRSLHADGRSRRAVWFLLLPVVVMAAWSAWFVRARIARYEQTDRARVATISTGQLGITAEFASPDAYERIHRGQPARFHTNFGSIPAHVTKAGIPVELAMDDQSTTLTPGASGSLEIQVETVSPAALLLRAVGQRKQAP
jgi:hypothetical protein